MNEARPDANEAEATVGPASPSARSGQVDALHPKAVPPRALAPDALDVVVHRPAYAAFRRQVFFWLGAFALFVAILVVFRAILLPFIAGMALAYLLDPVADRLERWGLPRVAATAVILVGFLLVFVAAILGVVPLLIDQTTQFLERLPDYVRRLQALFLAEGSLLRRLIGEPGTAIEENLNTVLSEGAGFLAGLVASIWSGGRALVDVIGLFVVTPVVAFYLLLDWDRMVASVDGLAPRDHVGTIRAIARDINRAVAGFVRGQGTVCILLGLFYAIGLSLIGLNFGLLIGLFAGLISFVPFVGSIIGLVLSMGVALVQFWPEGEFVRLALVAIVFFAGQFLEGNILQPKLVGERVGLHPVWLMFALFAFGSLFGFTGLLVAVPASAAIGVLVRFAIERYIESDFYRGHEPAPREAAE